MDKIKANYEKIKAQIAPYNPIIIAVTKYFDEKQIIKYYDLGFRDFGENRVKDALAKMEKLPLEIINNSRFHLIGHLQTNKAKLAVGKFDLIHSVDSVKLADIVNEQYEKEINSMNAVKICGLMNMAPIDSSEEELHKLFGNIKQIYDDLQSELRVELNQLSMGMSRDFKIALEEGATMIRLGRILFE